VHSLPDVSHDRHVVPTPLFTHLTLDRRHRMQAIDERIRFCACRGEDPGAAYGFPSGAAAAVLEEDCVWCTEGLPLLREWRRESARRFSAGGSTMGRVEVERLSRRSCRSRSRRAVADSD